MKKLFTKLIILFVLFMIFSNTSSFAHSPHDVIFDIVLSPTFNIDKTVFAITSNTLIKSTDEGYSWKKLANGIDYKSQLTSINISPTFEVDNTILVTSENGAIYRSIDGGNSWQLNGIKSDEIKIQSICLSPHFSIDNAALAIDKQGNLYRSVDSARSWEQVSYEFDGKVTCARYFEDQGIEHIIIATEEGRAFVSDSNKLSWRKIDNFHAHDTITCIAVSPADKENGKIWLGTHQSGVLELDQRHNKVEKVNQGLTDPSITSLLATTNSKNEIVLYASSWNNALFALNVENKTWTKYGSGLTKDPQADDPHFARPHFIGIAANENILYLGGFDGLFKSITGGKTWNQLDTILLSGITGLDVYSALDTDHNEIALATYGAGAYLYHSDSGKWSIINNGLDWTRLNDIRFSPNYSKDGLIFSGSENNFLIFHSDRKAWELVPVRIDFKRKLAMRISYYLKKIGFGDKLRNRIYKPMSTDTLFPTAIIASPNISNDETIYFGTRSSGLYCSNDSGKSNTRSWNPGEYLITSICLSPQFESDHTMYIGLSGKGIYKSTDKGRSWIESDMNIPKSGEVILAISPDFANDRIIIAGNSTGLYMTQNGGQEWHAIGRSTLGENPNIKAIAISPAFKNDKPIMVSVTGSGIWASRDMGLHFSKTAVQLIDNNYQAKFIRYSDNFEADGTIYCASSYELFRSLDRGKTWAIVPRPTRYENFREELKYTGDWQIISDKQFSALNASRANTRGSMVKLRFKGTGFSWIGEKTPKGGQANIRLDGKSIALVSQKSETIKKSAEIYSINGLPEKSRELSIELSCPENGSTCGEITVDVIDIIPFEPGPAIAVQSMTEE